MKVFPCTTKHRQRQKGSEPREAPDPVNPLRLVRLKSGHKPLHRCGSVTTSVDITMVIVSVTMPSVPWRDVCRQRRKDEGQYPKDERLDEAEK